MPRAPEETRPVSKMRAFARKAFLGAVMVGVALAPVLSGFGLSHAAPTGKQSPEKKVPLGPSQLTDKILLDLEAKRRAIAQREIEIRKEENRLMELRADIKKRIATLKKIESRLRDTLKKEDSSDKESIDHLVRAYSAMGADDAAQLLNTMNLKLAVRILREMQVKKAGSILAVVEPRRAARISERLAQAKTKR